MTSFKDQLSLYTKFCFVLMVDLVKSPRWWAISLKDYQHPDILSRKSLAGFPCSGMSEINPRLWPTLGPNMMFHVKLVVLLFCSFISVCSFWEKK